MKSMTGYGKAVLNKDNYVATVELKSVNHRFLDLGTKLPKTLLFAEDGIKKAISEKLSRGHVDVFVTLEDKNESAYQLSLNEALAAQYKVAADRLSSLLGVENDMTATALVKMNDVVTITDAGDENAIKSVLFECAQAAACELDKMRAVEGEALKKDLLTKIDNIESLTLSVEKRAPEVAASYKTKLEARMKEILEGVDPDESKLLTEVALFVDRAAIDEEITRLKTHVAHFRSIAEEKTPVGRKLDFLVQEINRECNTIGSKANDMAITDMVLSLKNEVEKLREQVQNVE